MLSLNSIDNFIKELANKLKQLDKRLSSVEKHEQSSLNAIQAIGYTVNTTLAAGATLTTANLRSDPIPTFARGIFGILEVEPLANDYIIYVNSADVVPGLYSPYVSWVSSTSGLVTSMLLVPLSSSGMITFSCVSGAVISPALKFVITGYWT